MHIPKAFVSYAILPLLAAAISSCHGDDEPPPPLPAVEKKIVFIFSPGGLGDMSYNDRILEGLQRFKIEFSEIETYIYSPPSVDEGAIIFGDWLALPRSEVQTLFVLGSSDYEPMAERHLASRSLTDNKSLLMFESRKQYADPRIFTFQISMYGASFLAGKVARECAEKSLIVLANDSDGPIAVAADGFRDGWGAPCEVEYLADDWRGFVSASAAYRKMSSWAQGYGFVFSVAGGSNTGIYRYTREFDVSPFTAGMDVDQSSLSDKITGSVIKRIDDLLYEYLRRWATDEGIPEAIHYGLSSGYVDWKLAPLYKEKFEDLVEGWRPTAIEKEKTYYETYSD